MDNLESNEPRVLRMKVVSRQNEKKERTTNGICIVYKSHRSHSFTVSGRGIDQHCRLLFKQVFIIIADCKNRTVHQPDYSAVILQDGWQNCRNDVVAGIEARLTFLSFIIIGSVFRNGYQQVERLRCPISLIGKMLI